MPSSIPVSASTKANMEVTSTSTTPSPESLTAVQSRTPFQNAMRRFFPRFTLDQLDDGRLYWYGAIKTRVLNDDNEWYLQVIYQNNHPDNSTYGGSIRVYAIDPDLDELYAEIGNIPHVLRDENGHLYICTARQGDFLANAEESSSAASAIAWAVKWITVFELWLDGKVATPEFQSHTF